MSGTPHFIRFFQGPTGPTHERESRSADESPLRNHYPPARFPPSCLGPNRRSPFRYNPAGAADRTSHGMATEILFLLDSNGPEVSMPPCTLCDGEPYTARTSAAWQPA